MIMKNPWDIEENNKNNVNNTNNLNNKNTDNIEKDYAWVSCNYMGTGVKIPISELDFNDFKDVDPEVFRHCATWTYVYNKKKNN